MVGTTERGIALSIEITPTPWNVHENASLRLRLINSRTTKIYNVQINIISISGSIIFNGSPRLIFAMSVLRSSGAYEKIADMSVPVDTKGTTDGVLAIAEYSDEISPDRVENISV